MRAFSLGVLAVVLTAGAVASFTGCDLTAAEKGTGKLPDKQPWGKSDEDAPTEFTKTASGLKYRVARKGDGEMPKATNTVKVHYHGWLDSGKVFDSSYKRGEPISFGLKQVIPGWTEGMQLVGKGGMIELEIPGELGYGKRGSPPDIGPNATLHFMVELLDVK